MRQKEHFLSAFLVFFFLSFLFWGLSSLGVFNGVRNFLEKITSPLAGAKYSLFQKIPAIFADPRIKKLTAENIALRNRIADQKRLKEENAALLDQFKTTIPVSYNLVPAQIMGVSGFMPGLASPTSFILNKGTKNGIKSGLAVVLENNLIGKITKTSSNLSKVDLITNSFSSFAAKTQNEVLGVIKGTGDKMILGNVVLSKDLSAGDTVWAYGDLNIDGTGYPPNLLVGKIVSVDKNPSALFQEAEVKSILDFPTLTTVFVIMQPY